MLFAIAEINIKGSQKHKNFGIVRTSIEYYGFLDTEVAVRWEWMISEIETLADLVLDLMLH